MSDIELAWSILTGFGAVMGWTFVIRYALAPRHYRGGPWVRRWWRSATGWNLMVFTTAIALALTLLVFDQAVGPFPRWVWLLVIVVFDVAIFHRVLLLFYDDHHERGGDGSPVCERSHPTARP